MSFSPCARAVAEAPGSKVQATARSMQRRWNMVFPLSHFVNELQRDLGADTAVFIGPRGGMTLAQDVMASNKILINANPPNMSARTRSTRDCHNQRKNST